MNSTPPVPRLAFTIADALLTGAFANRNALYRALARGELESWRDGRRRMISAASLERYVSERVSATRATEGS
jgi:excisionase family DNA binding protein